MYIHTLFSLQSTLSVVQCHVCMKKIACRMQSIKFDVRIALLHVHSTFVNVVHVINLLPLHHFARCARAGDNSYVTRIRVASTYVEPSLA